MRKILVGANINAKYKTAIADVAPDEWLLGADLGERLKTVKSLERSAQDLKIAKRQQRYGTF